MGGKVYFSHSFGGFSPESVGPGAFGSIVTQHIMEVMHVGGSCSAHGSEEVKKQKDPGSQGPLQSLTLSDLTSSYHSFPLWFCQNPVVPQADNQAFTHGPLVDTYPSHSSNQMNSYLQLHKKFLTLYTK